MTIPPVFRYRILQEAKKLLEKNRVDFICEAITLASTEWDKYNLYEAYSYDLIPPKFPEILKRKPKGKRYCWFPLSPDGRQSRIDLITEAMAELEQSFQKTA